MGCCFTQLYDKYQITSLYFQIFNFPFIWIPATALYVKKIIQKRQLRNYCNMILCIRHFLIVKLKFHFFLKHDKVKMLNQQLFLNLQFLNRIFFKLTSIIQNLRCFQALQGGKTIYKAIISHRLRSWKSRNFSINFIKNRWYWIRLHIQCSYRCTKISLFFFFHRLWFIWYITFYKNKIGIILHSNQAK